MGEMGNIYQNSTLTIVAASPSQVADGFLSTLKKNESAYQNLVKIPLYLDAKSKLQTLYVGELAREWYRQPNLEVEPLFSRGWSFQEYLLSSRALAFSSTQVSYKCREFYHTLLPLREAHLPVCSPIRWQEGVTGERVDSKEYARIWTHLIEDYSKRQWTIFEDQLSALAGVAAIFNMACKDKYLAGLWASVLVKHLCWVERRSEKPIFGDEDCDKDMRLPSWSWVSRLYPVDFRRYMDSQDAKLVDYKVDLVLDSSPCGPVRGASITLEARILKGRMLEAKKSTEKDKVLAEPGERELLGKALLALGNNLYDFKFPFTVRLIYLGHRSPTIYYPHWMMQFLVVQQLSTALFVRIGVFEAPTDAPRKGDDWWHLIMDMEKEYITIELLRPRHNTPTQGPQGGP
ncbi:hypothetical protein QBC38DRAFT_505406 [Podospora fimiseda]|uniref:Heterokaryon incompatibility domain-containing protein n=1 Tax=Podospora fimiseda TaxID=252190 RepID=A0AAN7BEH9_9PEZI|nr:hypothetical protein QBC38DRAFT_505406 [Podospora fimiseda]